MFSSLPYDPIVIVFLLVSADPYSLIVFAAITISFSTYPCSVLSLTTLVHLMFVILLFQNYNRKTICLTMCKPNNTCYDQDRPKERSGALNVERVAVL